MSAIAPVILFLMKFLLTPTFWITHIDSINASVFYTVNAYTTNEKHPIVVKVNTL